ncbi:MAG: MBL fold metallo-hydrolase [Candidatus Tectimicrobiota bacterium]
MRATLLGHACWLFETSAGRLISDPLFFDPFEEGTVTSCPRREVQVARLPSLQGVVISHRHLDHYDFPSLAVLDRRLPVYCPDDPFLLYGLQRLGFHTIHRLQALVPVQCGDLQLLPTPSLNREVLEYGLLLRDPTGTLFNQVDTFLSAETVQHLRRSAGQLDVHLAMYASQHFHFFESQQENTAAMHGINLHTATHLAARCVVPAAAGFRFVDTLGWLNRHVFPITQQQFVRDLQRLNPAQQIESLYPGDTLSITSGQITVQRQAADYVRLLADDTDLLTYDASAPIPPLHDANPAGYGLRGLQEFVRGLLEQGLPQYLARGLATDDPLLSQYRRYDVVYAVEVVFPEALPQTWTFLFDRQSRRVQQPRPAEAPAPTVRKSIAASALVDLYLGRRSYFAVRAQSRRSVQVFDVRQTARGVTAQAVELPDLLTHYILHESPGAEHRGSDWIHCVTRHLVEAGDTSLGSGPAV